MHRSRTVLGGALLVLCGAGAFVVHGCLFRAGGGMCSDGRRADGVAPAEARPASPLGGLAARPRAAESRPASDADVHAGADEGADVEDAADEVERVDGVVLAARTGAPVRGAQVSVREAVVSTDQDGVYVLRASRASLRDGLLRVRADGFVERVVELESAARTAAGRLGAVVLEPVVARLPGRVRDWRGSPVAGVTVELGFAGPRVVSDAAGSFGPVAVGARSLDWRAWSRTEPPFRGSWAPEADEWPAELAIDLPAPALVEGLVVGDDGRPLPGANVFDTRAPDALVLATDGEGRFAWPAAVGTDATLAATKGDCAGTAWVFAGAPTRIVAAVGGWWGPSSASPPPAAPTPCSRQGADGPRSRACVRIVDEAGRPWAGARLDVACEEGPWGMVAVTGPDGAAWLDFPDAALVVRASHPLGDPLVPLRVESPNSPMPATIVVPRRRESREPGGVMPEPVAAACVTGRVLDAAGRPVAGVRVTADRESTTTDERGSFRLEVGGARSSVEARILAVGFPLLRRIAAVGGPALVVTLPARGAIRVALVGTPPQGEGRGAPEVRLWTSARLDEAVLDDDRSPFVVDGGDHLRIDAPEGRYVLACRVKPGAWMFVPDVDVRPARATEVTYAFPVLHGLRGRVRAPSGEPVADAEISVASTGAVLGETDAAGMLDLTAAEVVAVKAVVPSGEVRLRVASRGFAPALTSPLDTTHDVAFEVTLEPGARVAGALLAADGAPVRGEVSWLPDAGPAVFTATSSRADGAFELDPMLPFGRQRLRVVVEGREPFVVETLVDAASPARELVLRVP